MDQRTLDQWGRWGEEERQWSLSSDGPETVLASSPAINARSVYASIWPDIPANPRWHRPQLGGPLAPMTTGVILATPESPGLPLLHV